jgi:hypothetical protein
LTETGADGAGVSLAFNTVGWKPQNIFFQTVDALVGAGIGEVDEGSTNRARVEDSQVDAIGDVQIRVDQAGSLTTVIGNETTSAASALFNASGKAISAILAMNRLASQTRAEVLDSELRSEGSITIQAVEALALDAESDLKALSSTGNTAGASIAGALLDSLTRGYDYTTRSGVQDLKDGDLVYVASDHDAAKGVKRGVYRYKGEALTLNLGRLDYFDTDQWARVSAGNLAPARSWPASASLSLAMRMSKCWPRSAAT